MMQRPSVGRIVHYVSYGTPGGEYASECRAAIVTEVTPGREYASVASGGDPVDAGPGEVIGLAVLNPTGMFFNRDIEHDEHDKNGGTWHWPERTDDNG